MEGTVKPHQPFNAQDDAKVLRKAMKGLGTDEKAIIDVLCHRSNEQRQQIIVAFKTMYGKDMIKDLKSELGGKFEDVVLGLTLKPRAYDASCLKNAIRGIGTDEDTLIEVMCSRSNAEMAEIKKMYKEMYGKTLEDDIISDTSGHFKRLLVSMSAGGRDESTQVDAGRASTDAKTLYEAGEKKWGTDESTFNSILAAQSYVQLRQVFAEYEKLRGKRMEDAVKSEMSGDLEKGMVTIIKCVRDMQGYFAEQLYKSMKGLGTDDRALVRIIITRCEVDMVQIKQKFQSMYGKSLGQFIKDDTGGDYKRSLLALVGEPY